MGKNVLSGESREDIGTEWSGQSSRRGGAPAVMASKLLETFHPAVKEET